MSHGAGGGNAEQFVGKRAGRPGATGDVSGPRPQRGRLRPVSPAGSELENRSPFSRPDNTLRLGRDERLVVDDGENKCLDKLGLGSRSAND